MDGLDAASVRTAVLEARPDVIVHELTALGGVGARPQALRRQFATTNALRTRGTDNLLAAAREAGVGAIHGAELRRLAERAHRRPGEDRGGPDRPRRRRRRRGRRSPRSGTSSRRRRDAGGPRAALRRPLRAGHVIGRGGELLDMVAGGKLPLVGDGAGVWSFCPHRRRGIGHARSPSTRGAPGVYNIVDDEPAPVVRVAAGARRVIGAKPPRHVPAGSHGRSSASTACRS